MSHPVLWSVKRLFDIKVNYAISVLVPVFLACNRRRETKVKTPPTEKDIRENVINYDDEGGGEDDMTAFDITTLQIPVNEMRESSDIEETKC